MSLPKIQTPSFSVVIPSLQKEVKFRPFLVKEEKILLLAQNSGGKDEIEALIQIINNCCLEDIDVEGLTTFDVEYIFLKLRARSVNNIVKLKYRDTEDEKVYDFEVNLDEIEIKTSETNEKKIQINDDVGLMMKHPNVKISQQVANIENEVELLNNILVHCIDYIYDKENVYPAKESTHEELIDFLENLDTKTFKKIEEFFLTMPKLYHELHYKNSLDHDRVIKLESIQDFFT